MKTVIVERTLTEPTTADALAARLSASPCLDAHGVRLIRSLVSLDGLRLVCEYEAPDAESVRQANRKAGLAFDRVWTAHEVKPAAPTPDGAKG